ncbi:MAG: methyltransferase [Porticoccaceae bacterium]|nr:methyltransferase [Porticoccaceae bacterium]MDG1473810.1 methyltransferase [Porticoccaceae bacterium]
MIDINVAQLLDQLCVIKGKKLIVADENWASVNWVDIALQRHGDLQLISNRYDIAQQAKASGLTVIFNDLDFSVFNKHSFDAILFRVSKERASSHHVINQSISLLKGQATLILSGEKNDGIKSYVKKACTLMSDDSLAKKNGANYLAKITFHQASKNLLNDNNYQMIRTLEAIPDKNISSKPGIFGWDKVDRGSAFLATQLPTFLKRFKHPPERLLDLGCGYGYLAYCALKLNFKEITLTDNNAAALLAVTENFKGSSHQINIVASDAGDTITEQFDTILCNPPFHQGFAVDGDMCTKFLAATKRLLAPQGHALFVVNTFIPLEKKAKHYFNVIDILASDGSFKLVALS